MDGHLPSAPPASSPSRFLASSRNSPAGASKALAGPWNVRLAGWLPWAWVWAYTMNGGDAGTVRRKIVLRSYFRTGLLMAKYSIRTIWKTAAVASVVLAGLFAAAVGWHRYEHPYDTLEQERNALGLEINRVQSRIVPPEGTSKADVEKVFGPPADFSGGGMGPPSSSIHLGNLALTCMSCSMVRGNECCTTTPQHAGVGGVGVLTRICRPIEWKVRVHQNRSVRIMKSSSWCRSRWKYLALELPCQGCEPPLQNTPIV